eukprot:49501-Hanusia_phi.AAC.2
MDMAHRMGKAFVLRECIDRIELKASRLCGIKKERKENVCFATRRVFAPTHTRMAWGYYPPGMAHDEELVALMDRYNELFLQGSALKNMLIYVCNSCSADVQDPVTHTLCVFLTTPLTVSITKTGLAPFRDCNSVVYPFFCMSMEQRTLLLELMQLMQSKNYAILSTQMGGGGMAALNVQGDTHARRYLDTVEVMTQFYLAARDAHRGKLRECVRDNLCNIILQRVCSSVHIPRSTLNEVARRVGSDAA